MRFVCARALAQIQSKTGATRVAEDAAVQAVQASGKLEQQQKMDEDEKGQLSANMDSLRVEHEKLRSLMAKLPVLPPAGRRARGSSLSRLRFVGAVTRDASSTGTAPVTARYGGASACGRCDAAPDDEESAIHATAPTEEAAILAVPSPESANVASAQETANTPQQAKGSTDEDLQKILVSTPEVFVRYLRVACVCVPCLLIIFTTVAITFHFLER